MQTQRPRGQRDGRAVDGGDRALEHDRAGLCEYRVRIAEHGTGLTAIDQPALRGVGPVGESGVDKLASAFLDAGATTVLSAMWDVDDRQPQTS